MKTLAASKIQVADSLNLGTNVSDVRMPLSDFGFRMQYNFSAIPALEDSTGMKKTFTGLLGSHSTS